MRHPGHARKTVAGRARFHPRPLASVAALALLAGCSTLPGEDAAVVADTAAEDLAWSFARTAELETEVAKLETENARLAKRLADLEAARAADAASAQARPVAAGAATASSAKPESVVTAPQAGRALAGGAAPVDASPRLVQPTFASAEETVFENEASASDIPTESVMHGVHLASYRRAEDARAGWRRLQRENPDELGLLEPRVDTVTIEGRGEFLRLVGGGFADEAKAAALCERLNAKGVYCAVAGFNGERLSQAGSG